VGTGKESGVSGDREREGATFTSGGSAGTRLMSAPSSILIVGQLFYHRFWINENGDREREYVGVWGREKMLKS
jgi:hypothetical protein